MAFYIPKGKELKITVGNKKLIENVPIILAEDITLTLSSKFQSLVSGDAQPIISALGGVFRDLAGVGFSGTFKEFGFQQWTGTDPIALSITVEFFMRRNAREDVYEPTMKLIELPLPSDGFVVGGLIPPGPSLLSVLDPKNKAGKVIAIQIGNILRINNIIVERAEPTFSTEIDEYGYPINSKIRLDIKSVYTATVQLLNVINQRDIGELY